MNLIKIAQTLPADDVVPSVVGDETGTTLFAGGFGTDESPYLIENAEQFLNIDKLEDEFLQGKSYSFRQEANITGLLSGLNYFRGTYDGNNYSIAANTGAYEGVIVLVRFPLGEVTIKNITTVSTPTIGMTVIYMSQYAKEPYHIQHYGQLCQ